MAPHDVSHAQPPSATSHPDPGISATLGACFWQRAYLCPHTQLLWQAVWAEGHRTTQVSLQMESPQPSHPAACSRRSGIKATRSTPRASVHCTRPVLLRCLAQVLLPGLHWPLCQKIPGQAKAICLENKPYAEPPQDGPRRFGLIPKLRAQTKPHKSGGNFWLFF